jgi:hypothetical protein
MIAVIFQTHNNQSKKRRLWSMKVDISRGSGQLKLERTPHSNICRKLTQQYLMYCILQTIHSRVCWLQLLYSRWLVAYRVCCCWVWVLSCRCCCIKKQIQQICTDTVSKKLAICTGAELGEIVVQEGNGWWLTELLSVDWWWPAAYH